MRFLFIFALIINPAWSGEWTEESHWCGTPKQGKNLKNIQLAYWTKNYPRPLRSHYKKPPLVFSTDLNGDRKKDFIVQGEYKRDLKNIQYTEVCYFDHKGIKKSCQKNYHLIDNFQYCFFAQLDDDPWLEVFFLTGWEDRNHFKAYKFDKNWVLNELFEILPVIKSTSKKRKGYYWGYPWDITGLLLKGDRPWATLNHQFGRCQSKFDGDMSCIFNDVNDQAKPVYLFEGVPTQGDKTGSYHYFSKLKNTMSLKELIKQSQLIKAGLQVKKSRQ